MSQPINLSEEQREFRAVVRRFADDKIAPRAAATDQTAEYDWDAFKVRARRWLRKPSPPRSWRGRVPRPA